MENNAMDLELLQIAQKGDNDAFDQIVKQNLSLVYRYLVRLTQDPALAEDVTQETFIRAWQNIHRFDLTRPFRPWLMRIARNCALDILRKKRVLSFSALANNDQDTVALIPSTHLNPHERAEKSETANEVSAILATMSDKEREVLILHYLEKLSANEIATVLSLPLETVRTRLRRARHTFRLHNEPANAPSSVVVSEDANEPQRTKPATGLSPYPLNP